MGIFDNGNPGEGDQHHDGGGDSSGTNNLMLRGSGLPLFIKINGEERGTSVEDPGERAHERGQETGDDNAANSRRQEVLNHHGEGAVGDGRNGVTVRTDHGGQFGNFAAAREGVTDQARDQKKVDGEKLEKGGKNAAAARDGLIGSAEGALHDVLVGAPIPEPNDGRAEEHAEPREIAVEIPSFPNDLARGVGLHDRGPSALDAGGDERLPEIEHIRAAPVAELTPSAETNQAVAGQQRGAGDQDGDLDGIVVSHGAHAAQGCVESGEHDNEHGADPEAVDGGAADVQTQLGKESAEDHAAGEDPNGDFGNHKGDERNDRKDVTRMHAEAALQELGHGEDHGAHVEGYEDPGQNQEAPGVQFVVGHGHAAGRAGTRKADDMFRSDIGSENGSADDPPTEIAPGEEIVGGGVLSLANDQDGEVERDHQPVNSCDARLADRGEQQGARETHENLYRIRIDLPAAGFCREEESRSAEISADRAPRNRRG